MGYLTDILYFSSGHECPESYQQWSALSLLGAVVGRKVWVMHGDYFMVLPNLYVCLVGDAGSGKSTAKNVAKKIFTQHFPDYLVAASFQSHQDIIDQMCNAPATRTWQDTLNQLGEGPDKIHGYTSFYAICNELASLLSTHKEGMVEFLVDIFDENTYSTGFKGQRKMSPDSKQRLDNPYLSVLSCATPRWFMGNLRNDLFEGGLGRRLIIVFDENKKCIPFPRKPEGADEAFTRAVQHLKAAEDVQGRITLDPKANSWWDHFYRSNKKRFIEDPIIAQFATTKPIQLLKVAGLLCLCNQPFTFTLTEDHLSAALGMLNALEPKIQRLTSGIGRNELAGVGAEIMDFIVRMGGAVPVIAVKKMFWRQAQGPEFAQLIAHYEETGELRTVPDTQGRMCYVIPDIYAANHPQGETNKGVTNEPSTAPNDSPSH